MRFSPALLLLAFASFPAAAQQIDFARGGQVEVTAAGGFEWREQEQKVIATGEARAVRGTVTVLADRLIAHYRKRATAPAPTPTAVVPGATDSGNTEIYRIEAEGHVRILTPTDEAVGDRAIYDLDQAVMVMTGHALRLTTPQQILTARDGLEYWADRRMAVARGAAKVVTTDARQITADTLVGYTTAPANPASAPPAGNAPADPTASGKLQRVEAFGNVEVRTVTDTVRGDRAVYVPDSGLARVIGHVRVTHGQNQLNGPAADVNMKTGVARMIADPGLRVQGLIMPNDSQGATAAAPPSAPVTPAPRPAPKAKP